MKLDGDLVDVLRFAFVVHPGVFEAGIGNEDQVFVADRFHRVAHDPLSPFGVLDEIDFAFGMNVNREIEGRFKAFHYDKAIFIR